MHTLEVFLGMLKAINIEILADLRSFPGSRKFSRLSKENLLDSSATNGLENVNLPLGGGRRNENKNSDYSSRHYSAFRGYSDYTATPIFHQGIREFGLYGEQIE